jgi:uncharacterized protein YbjT (DUF2867 family)
MEANMAKILVIGGTGMLGRPVTLELIKENFDVRLFTTDEGKARAIFKDSVEYGIGNVSDPVSLRKAMDDCDFVYINLRGGPGRADYFKVEERGSKNIYAAARDMGIKKVIQISVANVSEKNNGYIYIKVKLEAQKALRASGLTYTILRPSWFCESLPLLLQKDKMVFVGSGRTSFYFLAAADYARIVARCFQTDRADNRILTIFGPEPMPIPEALRRFLSIAHPDVRIDHLPIWLAKFSAFITFSKKLRAAVDLMAFYDRHDDSEVEIGPEEADRLFGRCQTTVELWSEVYRKVIKGI